MGVVESSIVPARVSHVRQSPVDNRFVYSVDYLLLDEAVLLGQDPGPRLFSFGRPNLVSLRLSDHGVADCHGVEGARRLAADAGIDGIDRVLLLTHPRYWHYTFNPVSFWFLMGAAGNLRAVLAEVHNTFGDRHGYFCTGEDGADIAPDCWTVSAKRLHVSPFFDMTGQYRFRFLVDDARVSVRIVYEGAEGGRLDTSIAGLRRPLTDRELARALLRRPFGAARMTALIHWQAFRLWRKGVRYRRRPEPPQKSIT